MTEQDEPDAEAPKSEKDPLDSWEEGSAFGVSDDSDPVCETPVDEWIEGLASSPLSRCLSRQNWSIR